MVVETWTGQTVLDRWPFDAYDRKCIAKGDFPTVYNYDPIIESFGDPLVVVSVGDYQGDTYAVVSDSDRGYAFVEIGWGSCSGCDALQACTTTKEVADLRNSLFAGLVYRSLDEMLNWLRSHDWRGDFGWYAEEKRDAIRRIIDRLAERAGQPKKNYGTAALGEED